MRDGDEWVLNGQKVWTSGAQYSDIGEIITRTATYPDSRHRGLTMFLVDMKAPGVEVRPLRQMTGGASFNEVFFTDVRVPDHRLGDVDEGWTVALTTLMNERAAIGGGGVGSGLNLAGRLRAPDPAHGRGRRPQRPPAAGRRPHPPLGGPVHEPAGHGQDAGRPAAGPGDVDPQAGPDQQHAADVGSARLAARAPPGRRHRRVGHLRLERVHPRRARHAGGGRHRRGPAQHHRRAGAWPAGRVAPKS